MQKDEQRQMKWWGWGAEGTRLDVSDKPGLWPYIQKTLGIDIFQPTPPVRLEDIKLSPVHVEPTFMSALKDLLRDDQVSTDHKQRVIHSYGKSFRDLWRMRNALVEASPDVVVYPEDEAQVVAIVTLCDQMNVVLIPFGGGSNIVGGLDAAQAKGRTVVSLDMKRMNKVLQVDSDSMTATIEAGVLGPDMEEQLKKSGVTLGHFPDSFVHSTLGGWIATRSAGMQSDKYGKIEDMVLSIRLVTPKGTIVTRTVPKSASGININHLCIGSEGVLGVITQATMQVHKIPACRHPHGYIFPNWQSGVAAMRECVDQGLIPVVSRLNDPMKTGLSFAYKAESSSTVAKLVSKLIKWYMFSVRKFDP
ncbi:MAG: FAD-binding oxidoreductase, partial [Deltaproteobacteria bacterium]|nr:FAD-binding oxidoreductase [Deltaproteobacteria bacterium]